MRLTASGTGRASPQLESLCMIVMALLLWAGVE